LSAAGPAGSTAALFRQPRRARLRGHRQGAQPAGAQVLQRPGTGENMTWTCPLMRSVIAGTIRHVDHVDAGHHLEQFSGDVFRAPDAGRSHVELARIYLGVCNELWDRLRRDRSGAAA
jgi:hypothetical protein